MNKPNNKATPETKILESAPTKDVPYWWMYSSDFADDNATILFTRDCRAWVVDLSPAKRPFEWLLINLLCCGASIVILFDTIMSLQHPSWHAFASATYLVYNCATTAVWCIEMSLTVLHRFSSKEPLSWALKIEVALALFFFYDSMQLLMEWRLFEDDGWENLFDAVFNILAYLYVSYECTVMCERNQITQQQQPQQPHSTTVLASPSSLSSLSEVLVPWPGGHEQRGTCCPKAVHGMLINVLHAWRAIFFLGSKRKLCSFSFAQNFQVQAWSQHSLQEVCCIFDWLDPYIVDYRVHNYCRLPIAFTSWVIWNKKTMYNLMCFWGVGRVRILCPSSSWIS